MKFVYVLLQHDVASPPQDRLCDAFLESARSGSRLVRRAVTTRPHESEGLLPKDVVLGRVDGNDSWCFELVATGEPGFWAIEHRTASASASDVMGVRATIERRERALEQLLATLAPVADIAIDLAHASISLQTALGAFELHEHRLREIVQAEKVVVQFELRAIALMMDRAGDAE